MQRYQYLITPRSDMQAILPNWYNIAYRRSGAYKGMGLIRYPGTGIGDNGGNPGGDFGIDPGADIQEGGSYVPPAGFNPTQVFFPSGSSGSSTSSGAIPTWVPWAVGGLLVLLVMRGGRR